MIRDTNLKIKKSIIYTIFSLFSFFPLQNGFLAKETLFIGAIPDQQPEKLNRLYRLLSDELSQNLNVRVIYKPVTNYSATVTAFRTRDLDLVWFGGLTGVQARLQRKGAKVLAQRDIDVKFHSVFIAHHKSQLPLIQKVSDLKLLKGKRFTFGSESSTSGRLMPQYFLTKAGIELKDFKGGRPGFSGSHDATLALVQSGSYEAGVLNEQVWLLNKQRGRVDLSKVNLIWRTPPYVDYHWLAQPDLDERFGKGFTKKLQAVILGLNSNDPTEAKILNLFGSKKFIEANPNDYKNIERIGRKIGKIK
tara:strand:+ start:6529 stop:7443 length:915 start_codon:yes stop_codon:yes gene_type:complete